MEIYMGFCFSIVQAPLFWLVNGIFLSIYERLRSYTHKFFPGRTSIYGGLIYLLCGELAYMVCYWRARSYAIYWFVGDTCRHLEICGYICKFRGLTLFCDFFGQIYANLHPISDWFCNEWTCWQWHTFPDAVRNMW